jgi:hypothetical protein
MALIAAVETNEVPDASILEELHAGLRALAPAMHEEVRLAKADTASKAIGSDGPNPDQVRTNGSCGVWPADYFPLTVRAASCTISGG